MSLCMVNDEVVIGDVCVFFFQAEDGIRDLVRSRGLGDVYKRQLQAKSYLPDFKIGFLRKEWDLDVPG